MCYDSLVRQATLRRFSQAYEAAQILGASRIVYHSGMIPTVYYLEGWAQRMADFWNHFLNGKSGITVCMENVLDRYAAPPSLTGTYCAYTPTHNHVLEYGMRDGAAYDANHPYDNLDYRFYANILYDGAVYKGQTLNMHTTDGVAGTDLQPYGTSTTAGYTLTGYYMGKFVDETQNIDNNDTYASKQNYIIWRLAEAKLDYAEVLFNLGYTEEARAQVNDIRQRVHMDALPTITIDQILNERRVELAFEESTYWDMFRLGTVYQKRNGSTNPLKKITITVTKGTTKYQVSNIDRRASANYIFQLKQYYLPIPWSEVKYQQFDQNPDWNEI